MSDRVAQRFALGFRLQALAVGNMLAASTNLVLGPLESKASSQAAQRVVFWSACCQQLLAVPIFLKLKETRSAGTRPPHSEDAAPGSSKKKLGSLAELFGDPRWRRNTIVGMILAFAGVVGLWGIGFFSPDLVDIVFRKHFQGQGLSAQEISGKLTFWKGITSLLQNAGAFFGIYAFSRVTHPSWL